MAQDGDGQAEQVDQQIVKAEQRAQVAAADLGVGLAALQRCAQAGQDGIAPILDALRDLSIGMRQNSGYGLRA